MLKKQILYFYFYIFNINIFNIKNDIILFPSKVKYISNFNFDKETTLKEFYLINIIQAYNLYYSLYKKSLNNEDIIEIIHYLSIHYTYYEVYKKSLLLGLLRLCLNNDFNNAEKLQNMLYNLDPNSEALYFVSFITGANKILEFGPNPQKNIAIILDIENNEFKILYEKPQMKTLYYIIQYYLSEYYLYLAFKFFKYQKYTDVINYTKKILLRVNSHPLCALEALLLLLEVMCILDIKLLILKYYSIIKKIYLLNKNNILVENYYFKSLYLIKYYKNF